MEKETDEKLNEFTERLLKDLPLESPSLGFTTKLMSRIEVLSKSSITEYRPLISKKVWGVLGVLVFGVMAYFIFGNVQAENSWAATLQIDFLTGLELPAMPDFKISNVFFYAVIGFTFFIGIQVLFLKNHFDKRFSIY